MDLIRRSFSILGTIFFTVLVLGALVPKASHNVATALAQTAPALVQVANTSAAPVPVEDPARQGVTLVAFGPREYFSNWFSVGATYVVPPGHRLLVDDITGTFNTPAGSHISQSYMTATLNEYRVLGGFFHHHFVPQLVTQGNYNIYKISEKTWFYVDSPGDVSLFINTTGGDPVTDVEVALQGHLVDCTNACLGAENPPGSEDRPTQKK
jgi:hypothetical protein